MSARGARRVRGSVIVEFAFVAVPLMTGLIFTFEIARAMWVYHTLAYNVKAAARLAGVTASACDTCGVTLRTLAQQVRGAGLDPSALRLTLVPAAPVSCSPLTACSGSDAAWLPTGTNKPSQLEIDAVYSFASAFGTYTFTASSTQQVQF